MLTAKILKNMKEPILPLKSIVICSIIPRYIIRIIFKTVLKGPMIRKIGAILGAFFLTKKNKEGKISIKNKSIIIIGILK